MRAAIVLRRHQDDTPAGHNQKKKPFAHLLEDHMKTGNQRVLKKKKRVSPFIFFSFFFHLVKDKRKKEKKIAPAREGPAQRGSYSPVARTDFLLRPPLP